MKMETKNKESSKHLTPWVDVVLVTKISATNIALRGRTTRLISLNHADYQLREVASSLTIINERADKL